MLAYRVSALPVAVIGGGFESASRVSNLIATGAQIHLFAREEEICDKLRDVLAAVPAEVDLRRINRAFDPEKDFERDWGMVLSCLEPDEEDEERSLTKRIYKGAKERAIPVNCADVVECCDFWCVLFVSDKPGDEAPERTSPRFMSNFSSGPLQVAISTTGNAPGLSRRIKSLLQSALPESTGLAVQQTGKLRQKLKDAGIEQERRVKVMGRLQRELSFDTIAGLSDGDVEKFVEMVKSGSGVMEVVRWLGGASEGAQKALRGAGGGAVGRSVWDAVAGWFFPEPRPVKGSGAKAGKPASTAAPATATATPTTATEGSQVATADPAPQLELAPTEPVKPKIYLIGAGPGSPAHVTLQALDALKSADVVIADRLLPQPLLDLIPQSKLLIAPLKSGSGGKSDEAQADTDQTALEALRSGKSVARFKVGDPFLYGRGGEELLLFRSHGFEVEVVPGLSSVTAAPLLAGIPLTHRGKSDQILVITGRGEGGAMPRIPEWDAKRTLVILMGLGRLAKIVDLCFDKGYPRETGAVVIERAGHDSQRVTRGTLRDIVEVVEKQEPKVESPVTIVFGDVVGVLG